ncbi:hypothetical protein KAU55_06280 [Candidatus Bathyarchaeota archaeon]|nr:hypothetical protein [Candidatus Bathyarchaeota archaeon]
MGRVQIPPNQPTWKVVSSGQVASWRRLAAISLDKQESSWRESSCELGMRFASSEGQVEVRAENDSKPAVLP